MRRKDKEIQSDSDIRAIIRDARVCRLAMSENNRPYVVPLCFGCRNDSLYLHCAGEGRKLDILRSNPCVCFEFDTDVDIRPSENACNWSMKYRSVIGFGKAVFVKSPEEKQTALDIICRQYAPSRSFEFPEKSVNRTTIIRVDIESITGKQDA